ncbi:MAG: GntR family transcriptional regulator [Clostridiales bacterium]|jgi:K+/H+ antiporter YhaU regulatory subunit KhtT|nr:GntR family transcriptional regulator [Clostridiales bacterium]
MESLKPEQDVTISAYRQIAIDIAKDIANGKYKQGEILYGRSILASQYKVSSETIRKAIYLLSDIGVLESQKGRGVEVISTQKAKVFTQRYNSLRDISKVKLEIKNWAKSQAKQTADILEKIQFLIDETERINNAGLLNPFQIQITDQCKAIGKTVDELNFWHNTGGTIVAIKRNETMIISPGRYASFHKGDVFFIVGDETAHAMALKLLFE